MIFCLSCGLALAGWAISETCGQAPATKISTLSKTDVFEPPKLIQSAPPEYPSLARQMEKSGTVTIAIVVGTDGKVSKADIVSSTNPIFNDAALKAVKRWVFSPAKKNGKLVAISFTVPVIFDLRRR